MQPGARRAPRTAALLRDLGPQVTTMVSGAVYFSLMSPGARLRPHCGPTNSRLRVHLALSARRIADIQRVCFEEGVNFYVETHIDRVGGSEGSRAPAALPAETMDLVLKARPWVRGCGCGAVGGQLQRGSAYHRLGSGKSHRARRQHPRWCAWVRVRVRVRRTRKTTYPKPRPTRKLTLALTQPAEDTLCLKKLPCPL